MKPSGDVCLIISAMFSGEQPNWWENNGLVICADAGFARARSFHLQPDLVAGDFDSMKDTELAGFTGEVIRLPVEKDDTDTLYCLKEARRRGFHKFHLLGCLGGRLDHTYANLQALCDCAKRGEEAEMADHHHKVRIFAPGTYTIPREEDRKLSFFAYSEKASCVELCGCKWNLHGAVLDNFYPLGVSNAWAEEEAVLSFASGMILMIISSDPA
ncbi:MAG: thiamine diphosphokinase [Clostridia bacterium]|nr:thiamine diphosphokinase [Clostridia bacterium]